MAELAQVLACTFSQDPMDQQGALALLQKAIEGNFPEYVKQLAEVLTNTANAPYIRKAAGLQLKNTLISREQSSFDKNKLRWLSLHDDIRDYVKHCILKALGTETVRPSTAAQCVAAIACVEFPKLWPNLIDLLSANLNQPETTINNNYNGYPGLKECTLETFGYLSQDIQEKHTVGQILAAIVHGLATEQRSVHVRLAGTKALSEIVDWVVTKTLEEHVDTIVDLLCTYLQTAELNLYEEAAKCLYKIASRKCTKTMETPIVLSLFRDGPIKQILTAANLAASDSSSSAEHYKYLKALCDLLCALGIHLADVWSYVMKTPPNFTVYLSALTAFFTHPSIYIRAETANVLATFCGHERISKEREFATLVSGHPQCQDMPGLIEFLPRTMNRSYSVLTDQYSRMDYGGSELELQREYIRLRDHCLRMIRESAADHFDKLLIVIREWTLNRCVRASRDVKPDEWEVMKRFIAAVLQSSFQLDKATPEVRTQYLALFDAVLPCSEHILQTAQFTLLNGVLSILSALFPVFDDFPVRIPRTLDHFKAILLVHNPNNQNIEITATKRHAIALLLKIVSQFSGPVKPYDRNVFNLLGEVSPHISMMQRANLVHVLGALSNLATTAQEQTGFLQLALREDIEFVFNEQFSATPAAFLAHSEMTTAPDAQAILSQNCPRYLARLNLKASLTALEGVLNQISVPSPEHSASIFSLFEPIVPKFFQFAKTLNSIYEPDSVVFIHPAYGASVLEMAPSERQIIVSSIAVDMEMGDGNGGGVKKSEEFEPGQQAAAAVNGGGYASADMVVYMRKFICEISELVQSILGSLCARFSANLYAHSNASELMMCTVFAIKYVPNFRLRFWIRKTWYRMATCCPEQYAQALVPLMLTLIGHLQQRLVEQWAIVKKRQSGEEEDDEPSEEELIAESTMSLLSREYASFIAAFILGESFSLKSVKRESPLPTTPISRVLMTTTNGNMFLGTIGLMAKLMTCPDSQAAIKCVPAMNVLIYNYRTLIDEQTAKNLLIHAIQSLQQFANDELAAGPILVLIFNIYAQLRPRYKALLEVLKQVPTCLPENIDAFDQRILGMPDVEEATKLQDKMKRDLMRRVLTSTKLKGHNHRKASASEQLNGGGVDGDDREME